jgi:hypothetical protein
MTNFTCKGILDFLTEEQKEKLNNKFTSSVQNLMPHEVANPVGLKYSEVLAIFTVLQAGGFCKNLLLIYHDCDQDTIMKATPYEEGMPQLPCICELCQETIVDIDELSFEVMAKLQDSIKFI